MDNYFKLALIKKYGKEFGIFLSYLIEKLDNIDTVECNRNELYHDLSFDKKDILEVERKGKKYHFINSIKRENNKIFYKLNYINILFNLSSIGND